MKDEGATEMIAMACKHWEKHTGAEVAIMLRSAMIIP